jgi:hypothetical protein
MSNSVAFIDTQSFESNLRVKPWSDREICQTMTMTVLSRHRSTLLCQWNGRRNGSIGAWKKRWKHQRVPHSERPAPSKERNEITVCNLSEKLWPGNCMTIGEVDVERDRTLAL